MTVQPHFTRKTDSFFYFYTLSQRLCLVMLSVHSALSVLYNTLNVPELSILNALSVAAYYLALKLNLQGRLGWGWVVINLAAITYPFVSSFMVGVTNVRDMMMFLPMLFFLYPVSFQNRLAYLVAIAFTYVFLAYYQFIISPVYALEEHMLEVLNISMGALVICSLAYFIYYAYRAIKAQEDQMSRENDVLRNNYIEMERRAIQDNLTHLYNRYKIENIIEQEIERSRRHGAQLSVILMDIDHFKQINDTYGHVTGDAVLKEMAQLLTNNLRNLDSVARWGGEEFLIVSPETDKAGATILAEKLRKAIEEDVFCGDIKITASFGLSSYEATETFQTFFERTDGALYASKEAGRNRVTVR